MTVATNARQALQKRLDYRFSDPRLLERALTHRSVSARHMERLEFLGDAVLGLSVAEYLHDHFSEADEGSLSRMRASLVCREGLLSVADTWQLGAAIEVGEGERDAGGIKSPSILANAVEAVIGAIFSDGGWEAARRVVLKAWQPMLARAGKADQRDAKTRLQELTQGRGWGLPAYQVTDLGAGHSPRFQALCSVQGRQIGIGRGDRKKAAEAAAAEQAWEKLNR